MDNLLLLRSKFVIIVSGLYGKSVCDRADPRFLGTHNPKELVWGINHSHQQEDSWLTRNNSSWWGGLYNHSVDTEEGAYSSKYLLIFITIISYETSQQDSDPVFW